ncbi:rhomboid family intramembrane serine protease [Arachidicoccus sp.]|uniref:rhomboid family intramembrane serine protease n=1 Tax=Arachidicoccus sp. TaxID=1872624 RepID=UPI003D24FFFA
MNYKVPPQNKVTLGSTGNAIVLLIGANAVLFVLLAFFKIFYFMTATGNVADITLAAYHKEVFDYLTLPLSFAAFVHQPWTLISYMFTHESLLDLLSNLLWLAAFGYIMQSLAENRKIIPIYLYGGVIGGIIFLLLSSFLPSSANHLNYLIGATIPVIAIATAAVTLAPKYRIFPMLAGGVPLWILYLIYILINFSSATNAGLAFAFTIVVSALVGFFVIYQLKRGNDYCEWMYNLMYKIDSLFNPHKKFRSKPATEKFFYKTSRAPFKTEERITQEHVDELLDKISKKGYSSLSKTEREFLKRAGRE